MGSLLYLPQTLHIRMMTRKRSKWNPDPSREPESDGAGTHALGRGGRAVLPDSFDTADWQGASADAGLDRDKPCCSSAVRGHNLHRQKTSPGTGRSSRFLAAEQHRNDQPSALAGGARQRQWLRGNLEPAFVWSPDQGRHRNPVAYDGGVPALQRRLSKQHYSPSFTDDNWTRICACGADDWDDAISINVQ